MTGSLTTDWPELRDREQTRRTLRRVMIAMMFGCTWAAMIGGAPWIRFGEEMGLKRFNWIWGLMSAIPFLGTFVQLLGSYYVERSGRRKPLFYVGFMLQRLSWFAMGLLPWLVLPKTWAAIVGVMGLYFLYSSASAFAMPAWTNWMADAIPSRIRGRFFGIRQQLGMAVLIPVSLLTGWLLAGARQGELNIPYPRGLAEWGWWQVAFGWSPIRLYSVLCLVATVFGVIDLLLFWRVPDRRTAPAERPPGLRELLGPPLRNRRFVRFLVFYAAFQISVPGIGNYVWLYVLNGCQVPEVWAQAMFMGGGAMGAVVFAGLWGRLIDRFGRKTVWRIAYIVPVLLPALYGLLQPSYWALGFLITFIDGMCWNGVELTNFNSLLHFSSEERGGSSYQAVFAFTMAVAGTLSGLIFSGLTRLVNGWHADVAGFHLSYFHFLFAVATAIRLAVYMALLPLVHDDARHPVRVAVQYFVASTVSGLVDLVTLPWRTLGKIASPEPRQPDPPQPPESEPEPTETHTPGR